MGEPMFPILYQGCSQTNESRDRMRQLQLRLPSIPWSLIAPHEAQAQRNHDQSLKRLAERGGLSPGEALCTLGDRSLRELMTSPWTIEDETAHVVRLEALVISWEQANQPKWSAEHGCHDCRHGPATGSNVSDVCRECSRVPYSKWTRGE